MAWVIVVKSDDEEYSHQLDSFYSLACSFVNCSISQYILNFIIIGLKTTLHIKSLLFNPYRTPTFLAPLLCYLFLKSLNIFSHIYSAYKFIYLCVYAHVCTSESQSTTVWVGPFFLPCESLESNTVHSSSRYLCFTFEIQDWI